MAQERFNASPVGVSRPSRLPRPGVLAAHGVWVSGRRHRDSAGARRRRVAQSPKQHEAGERHRAGARPTCEPASPSGSAPTAPPATTTSTCSRRCARRARSCTSCRRAIPGVRTHGARDGHHRAARAPGHGPRIGSLEPGKRADLIVVGMTARGRRRCTTRSRTSSTSRAATTCGRRSSMGKVLMRDRQVLTLDEAAVLAEASGGREKVRAAVTAGAAIRA